MSKRKGQVGLSFLGSITFKLILVAGIASLFVVGLKDKLNDQVSTVFIHIEPLEGNKYLIKKEDVKELIRAHLGYQLEVASIENLNTRDLEELLNDNKVIEDSNIYIDKLNRVHIHITQMEPLVRIDFTSGLDYYLDRDGRYIPSVEKVAVRVPVVTGFGAAYSEGFQQDKAHILNDVLNVANFISKDPFLSALIEQIHVEKGEITVVPKLGRNRIVLGEATDIEEKFYKLKMYYKEGVRKVGLDKFKELNLEYAGHIVGVRSDS